MQANKHRHEGQNSAIPNLFWRSHHSDALRREDAFLALPEEVELVGIGSLRCEIGGRLANCAEASIQCLGV